MSENDVYNDYSHWHDRTGPYKRVDYIEYTHICDGCHEIVDSVDTDRDYATIARTRTR